MNIAKAREVTDLTVAVFLAVLLLVLAGGPAAWAQEEEVEGRAIRPTPFRSTSRELRSEKRRLAREGKWSFTPILVETFGYNSNIYASPKQVGARDDLEKGSAFLTSSLMLDTRRYFTRASRLRVTAEILQTQFFRKTRIDVFQQDLSGQYQQHFSKSTVAFLEVSGRHENDNAVDIYGHRFTQHFDYWKWEGEAGVEQEFLDDHEIEASFSVTRKDYRETNRRDSFDWWEYGPKLKYAYRRGGTNLWVWYFFFQRIYDDEIANSRDGTEPIGNPEEKHYYHRFLVRVAQQVTDPLELWVKYRYRVKDDRFEDFETYGEHGVELGATGQIGEPAVIEVSAFYKFRDYENRPGPSTGGHLEYGKWGGEVRGRYQINKYLSIFGGYSIVRRNTNRDSGDSYRDYSIHIVSVGVALAI